MRHAQKALRWREGERLRPKVERELGVLQGHCWEQSHATQLGSKPKCLSKCLAVACEGNAAVLMIQQAPNDIILQSGARTCQCTGKLWNIRNRAMEKLPGESMRLGSNFDNHPCTALLKVDHTRQLALKQYISTRFPPQVEQHGADTMMSVQDYQAVCTTVVLKMSAGGPLASPSIPEGRRLSAQIQAARPVSAHIDLSSMPTSQAPAGQSWVA